MELTLEAKTKKMLNELIQGMTRFCIESYKSGQPIVAEDIKALAELVAAVNTPIDHRGVESTSVVGFHLPQELDLDDETIGDYLKARRKEKGLTITQLSEISGVSHPYISQIENDKFKPSPDILKKLVGPLGVPYMDLLHKAGYLTHQDSGDDG
jgi:DNA-binding XRE family transcriptional regulator